MTECVIFYKRGDIEKFTDVFYREVASGLMTIKSGTPWSYSVSQRKISEYYNIKIYEKPRV